MNFLDCVECMACSDNVVRAGLTPKPKDVETLVDMLTYNCEPASAKRFQPSREDECTEIFRPPVPDFAVAKITVRRLCFRNIWRISDEKTSRNRRKTQKIRENQILHEFWVILGEFLIKKH